MVPALSPSRDRAGAVSGFQDITCRLCRDFSACRHGKTHIEGDCSSWGANAPTYLMRGRTSGRVWTLGFRGQFASADGAHHARPLLRHRLLHRRRHRLRHRLRRRRQRITTVGSAIEECRMQFPRPCVASRIRIVGIAMFVGTVESSPNRIACETAPSMCARRTRGPAGWFPRRLAARSSAPARTRARSCAPGPDTSHVGP